MYDTITLFVRDLFMDKVIERDESGKDTVMRYKPLGGPRRTIHELFACSWCMGMWMSCVLLFAYALIPFSWFIILILACAGAATFLQIFQISSDGALKVLK